jgi:hypothetical protein
MRSWHSDDAVAGRGLGQTSPRQRPQGASKNFKEPRRTSRNFEELQGTSKNLKEPQSTSRNFARVSRVLATNLFEAHAPQKEDAERKHREDTLRVRRLVLDATVVAAGARLSGTHRCEEHIEEARLSNTQLSGILQ